MSLRAFLDLVELRTKTASLVPFLLGTFWASWKGVDILPLRLILFFVSMISFDMLTTALNNYADRRRDGERGRGGRDVNPHNAIVAHNLPENKVRALLVLLFLVATLSGLLLAAESGPVVLVLGAACFGAGILYSAGPLPLSRTPLGEVVSGFFMGFVLPLIAATIHAGSGYFFAASVSGRQFEVAIDWPNFLGLFAASIPAMAGIAGIMLANNICDIDGDRADGRCTFPVSVGRKTSLTVFGLLQLAAVLSIPFSVAAGALPALALVALASIVPVRNNVARFGRLQTKKDTFKLSVANFLFVNLPLAAALAMATLLRRVG